MIMQPVALNLHSVGRHFVENITGIEEIPVVDPELSEEEEQPLTDIRFRVSVRGWNIKTHQSRAHTLLDKTDKQMVTTLHNDRRTGTFSLFPETGGQIKQVRWSRRIGQSVCNIRKHCTWTTCCKSTVDLWNPKRRNVTSLYDSEGLS